MYKSDTFYDNCDRYKKYLDGLIIKLVVKSIGGRYTKAYKELKEKYDKAYNKWEHMCKEADTKQKLESLGINIGPQRDVELYEEIYKKAKNKKNND